MSQPSYEILRISKNEGPTVYASGAFDFATGTTGVGGLYRTAAVSNNWTGVEFLNAISQVALPSTLTTVGIGASTVHKASGVILGGATPIGDIRGEGTGFVGIGTSSTPILKDTSYNGALYAVYFGAGSTQLTGKVGIGTTSTSNFYEGTFKTKDIYEFQPVFNVDTGDLTKVTTGSGVYGNSSVTLVSQITNREGVPLTTAAEVAADPLISGQRISIIDTGGSVIFNDYKITTSPSFTFTKQDNLDVFGTYQKNFGVRTQIVNSDGNSHTTDFILYGNSLSIEKVFARASGVSQLNESTGNISINTGSITNAVDRSLALQGFSRQTINNTGVSGFIDLQLFFDQDPSYTNYSNIHVHASNTGTGFNFTDSNLIGSFPLNQTQGQHIRLFPNDFGEFNESDINLSDDLFFKFRTESDISIDNQNFLVGPYRLEAIPQGDELFLGNGGAQTISGPDASLSVDDGSNGGTIFANTYSGSGISGRITDPFGRLYLVSGEGGGGTEADTLQTVTSRGNTTSTKVGICTTSTPTQCLEVAPDTDESAIIGKAHIGKAASNDFASFCHVDHASNTNYALNQNQHGDTKLNYANGRDLSFRRNNVEIGGFNSSADFFVDTDTLYVDSFTDRVGIGVSFPTHKLDIGGPTASTSNTIRIVQGNGGTALRFGAGGTSNDVTLLRVDGAGSAHGTTDSAAFGFSLKYMGSRNGNANSFSLFSDNQNAATQVEAITILQDGKVGIGVSVPTNKLDINGDVGGTGDGDRITLGGTPYLLSGDQNPSTDTLQDVVDRGNATTTDINFNGSKIIFDGGSNKSIGVSAVGSSSALTFGSDLTEIASASTDQIVLFPTQSVAIGASATIVGASPATGSAVLGGTGNVISGHFNTLVGGAQNKISGDLLGFNFIGGGSGIDITGSQYSSSVGGKNNDVLDSDFSIIGGGSNNKIEDASSSFIGGGDNNEIHSATVAFIGGGDNNEIHDGVSAIGGGVSNKISGGNGYSFIGGGEENEVHGTFSSVLGGEGNKVYGNDAVTLGGWFTESSGRFALVGPGEASIVSGDYAVGLGNKVEIPVDHTGATVLADGQDRVHASSGMHTATLDFAGGVHVPTSGMFGQGLFVSGVPVLTGENNPAEADTLQTVTDRGATTTNSITVGSNLDVGSAIRHNGNTSTKLEFTTDVLDLYAGSPHMIRLDGASTQNAIEFNIDSNDVDFKVGTSSSSHSLFVRGSDGKVGIGTNSPLARLHVEDTTLGYNQAVFKVVGGGGSTVQIDGQGTVWTPKINLLNTNQGIERDGSNKMSIFAGEVRIKDKFDNQRAVFDNNNGRLGIGTTTPRTDLSVFGNTDSPTVSVHATNNNVTGAVLRLVEGINHQGAFLRYDASANTFNIGVHDNNDTTFANDTSVISILRSNAKVGIGTTNPSEKLTVKGGDFSVDTDTFFVDTTNDRVGIGRVNPSHALNVIGDIKIDNANGTNAVDAGSLIFSESGDTFGTDMFGFRINQNGSTNRLKFQSANTSTVKDILTLTRDTARVGIGTTNPLEILDINGSVRIGQNDTLYMNNTNVGIKRDSNDLVLGGFGGIRFRSSSTDISSQTERMRITSAGNVGIGTTDPSKSLQVVGGISGEDIILDGGNSSDMAINFAGSNNGIYCDPVTQMRFAVDSASSAMVLSSNNIQFGAGGNSALSWSTNNYLEFNGGGTKARLNSVGLGVGTTDPTERLDVRGDTLLSGDVTVADGKDILLDGHSSQIQFDHAGNFIDKSSDANMRIRVQDNSATLRHELLGAREHDMNFRWFQGPHSSSFKELMTLSASGRLRIGQDTDGSVPDATLHVDNGGAVTTGFLVTNSSNKNILWAEDTENVNVRQVLNVYHTTVPTRYLRLSWGSIFANDNDNELSLGSNFSSTSATRILLAAESADNIPPNTIQMQANHGLAVFSGVSTDTFEPTALIDVRGDGFISGSVKGTGAGNRITNNGVPYLLSGDSPAETQTLQDVCDNGNTTSTSIISTGPHISGVTGLFEDVLAKGAFGIHGWEGDPDTHMKGFGDRIIFTVGGLTFADFFEGTQDGIRFNGNENQDIDFRVGYDGGASIFSRGSDGNLGIHTTSPSTKFHLGSGIARFQNAGSNYIEVDGSVAGANIARISSRFNRFEISTNAGAGDPDICLMPDAGGNVGIGSNAPAQALSISTAAEAKDNNIDFLVANSYNAGLLFRDPGGGRGSIVSNTDNDLIFSTNGTGVSAETMRIQDDGKVGIGTTDPTKRLSVKHDNGTALSPVAEFIGGGSANDETQIHVGNALGSTILGFNNGNGALTGKYGYVGISGAGANYQPIAFRTSNVGIGTTNPTEKLEVAPDSDVSAIIGHAHIGNIGSAGNAGFAQIDMANGTNFALLQTAVGKTILNSKAGLGINFNVGNVTVGGFAGSSDFFVDTDTLYVDASESKVGIGVTNPSKKLDVRGDTLLSGAATIRKNGTSNTNFLILDSPATVGANVNFIFEIGDDALGVSSKNLLLKGSSSSSDIVFSPSTSAEGLLMLDGGANRVGIGTTSPQRELQVLHSGVFGKIGPNSPNGNLTVAGYDYFGFNLNAHNGWTDWQIRAGHGQNLLLCNEGSVNQNQVLELGKTTKDNAKVYVRSTGAFIEAGMNNSTSIPVVSMGCLADTNFQGGAFLDVRDAVASTHRYEFNRDGTFVASGVNVSGDVGGTGDGGRITLNGTGYLLSGEAGTEADTLQTVTTRGNTTSTSIVSTGPFISGVTGLFSSDITVGGLINAPSGVAVTSDDVHFIVKLTQAEYDAITPDSNTLYFISDEATNSPVVNPIRTVTGNYTITDTDHTVLVSGSASTNITLPSAVNNSNYVYNIKNLTTGAVVISATAGLIDLSSSLTINSRFESVTAQSDGSNWYII